MTKQENKVKDSTLYSGGLSESTSISVDGEEFAHGQQIIGKQLEGMVASAEIGYQSIKKYLQDEAVYTQALDGGYYIPYTNIQFGGKVIKLKFADYKTPGSVNLMVCKNKSETSLEITQIILNIPVNAAEIDISSLNITLSKGDSLGIRNPVGFVHYKEDPAGYVLYATGDPYVGWEVINKRKGLFMMDFSYTIQTDAMVPEANDYQSTKTIAILADSIGAMSNLDPEKDWTVYMQDLTKFKEIKNYAAPGCCWTNTTKTTKTLLPQEGMTDNNVMYNQVYRLIQDNNEGRGFKPDVILLMMGVNDLGRNSPLGTMDYAIDIRALCLKQPNEVRTFYESVMYCIGNLQIAFREAHIILVTPIQTEDVTSKLLTLSNAMKQVAEYMSVPVIDAFARSGINRMNTPWYLYDGIHPYKPGAMKLGYFMSSEIKKECTNFFAYK